MTPLTKASCCDLLAHHITCWDKNLGSALTKFGLLMPSCIPMHITSTQSAVSRGLDFLRQSSNQEFVPDEQKIALEAISSSLSYAWLCEQETFETKKLRYLNEKEAADTLTKLLNKAPLLSSHGSTQGPPDGAPLDSRFHENDNLLKNYLSKNELWNKSQNHFARLLAEWPQTREQLKQLILPIDQIEDMVRRAGLPLYPEATNPTTTALEYRWALRFAPFICPYFCLADFIFWIGEDPCTLAAM